MPKIFMTHTSWAPLPLGGGGNDVPIYPFFIKKL